MLRTHKGCAQQSRLSWYKQKKLIAYLVSGTTARCAAQLAKVGKTTASYYFTRFRMLVARYLEKGDKVVFDGEIEVDESYFGGTRKGERGRSSAGKVPVFGSLKRNGKEYTRIIAGDSSNALIPIIKGKVVLDSIVYSDYWSGYNISDTSGFRHYGTNHSKLFSGTSIMLMG